MSFCERFGLRDEAGQRLAAEVAARAVKEGVQTIRLSWADQHGILRGKTIVAGELDGALSDGVAMTTTLLLKDSAHRTAFPVFTAGGGTGLKELEGAADCILLPDPSTFRLLPWAPGTGWMLCDAYFADGRAVPLSTRALLARATGRVAEAGYEAVMGIEVEFHLFRLLDPKLSPADAGQPGTPPEVALLTQGYNYLTESRYDAIEPVLEILRTNTLALGLPLRSMEVEYGPSQVEFTFAAREAREAADLMTLFRSAAKQVARRHGYHATFMCRPRIPHGDVERLAPAPVAPRPRDGAQPLRGGGRAALGLPARHYLGGLLHHAQAAAAFAAPTLNGYRRFRPYSLAPDRAIWGIDNRGVMVRAIGPAGQRRDAAREPRGEPAANPYLYIACQILFGLEGIAARRDPGPPADTPYERMPRRCRAAWPRRSPRWRRAGRRGRASAPPSSTTSSASSAPRSRASRRRCMSGNSANTSSCSDCRPR
jgi:glutamine synthetase